MARRPTPGNLPAGFPSEYKQHVVLKDGRLVTVRPVLPVDAPALLAALDRSDPETVRQSFPEGMPRDPAASMEAAVRIDYRTQFALVAFAPGGEVAAAGRYWLEPGDPARVGTAAGMRLIVLPDWQRVGLGRELLWALATRAKECGIDYFTGLTSADNDAMRALVEAGGGVLEVSGDLGLVSLVIDWSRAPH